MNISQNLSYLALINVDYLRLLWCSTFFSQFLFCFVCIEYEFKRKNEWVISALRLLFNSNFPLSAAPYFLLWFFTLLHTLYLERCECRPRSFNVLVPRLPNYLGQVQQGTTWDWCPNGRITIIYCLLTFRLADTLSVWICVCVDLCVFVFFSVFSSTYHVSTASRLRLTVDNEPRRRHRVSLRLILRFAHLIIRLLYCAFML